MATRGVTTRLQKDMRVMQNELAQLQVEFTQLDVRIDVRLKDLQERIKSEFHSKVRSGLRSEIHSLLKQYFGQTLPTAVTGLVSNKGKGILGGFPLNFSTNEHLVVSPMLDLRHIGVSFRGGTLDAMTNPFQVDCPHFDGGNFKGWWSKLKQHFKVEGVGDHAKVENIVLGPSRKGLLGGGGIGPVKPLFPTPKADQDTDVKSPTFKDFQNYPEQLEIVDQANETPTLVLPLHAL
ncbi:hypothetical protein J1N35_037211 [Gossypium stocksii]|uniref:Uncharacterized protein n=1 Tax=Gossypium stocksii TaxID=47602 RepID=A0A9D3ZLJ8_9ROSI|nr:hypothetical protein J1N35_037211 [Gossypium stocksii]